MRVTQSRLTWGLLLALSCAGCGGPGPDFPTGYVILRGDVHGSEPIGREALIMADNQEHYLYGEPVWIRQRVVDQFVTTAIRAPQLDLFGPAVLEEALHYLDPDPPPVIHLGDGMDLACVDEYQRFTRVMNTTQGEWFMAPGNHDGIYFGSSNEKSDWLAACSGGGGPMNQAAFVEGYVNDQLGRRDQSKDDGSRAFARTRRERKSGDWSYGGKDPAAWLTRVAWRVDDSAPHKSFVIQELTATMPHGAQPLKYILLDTANFEHEPRLLPIPPHVNPGSTGDLSAAQLSVLEGWLAGYTDATKYPGAKPAVVLMGHHPFGSLTQRAARRFDELRRKYGVLLYVSAHTHHGTYYSHTDDTSGWLELNVGSTIDWPLEFRTFRVLQPPANDGGAVFYTNSKLIELSEENAPDCNLEWQPKPGDPDYYVDYTRTFKDAPGTSKLIFDSLLRSYERMLGRLPRADGSLIPAIPTREGFSFPPVLGARTDEELAARIRAVAALGPDKPSLDIKRSLLRALRDFDDTRELPETLVGKPGTEETDAKSVHRLYRVCQAVWASQDDQTGVRRARRENNYVGYPPPKALPQAK